MGGLRSPPKELYGALESEVIPYLLSRGGGAEMVRATRPYRGMVFVYGMSALFLCPPTVVGEA